MIKLFNKEEVKNTRRTLRKNMPFIEQAGIHFLWFTNRDIYERMEGVLESIMNRLAKDNLP